MSQLKIQRNIEKIVKLLNENIDLQYKLQLKKYTRLSEEVKNTASKNKPEQLIKRGHWFEWFFDKDYPNDKKHAVKIERSEIYEIDGAKSNGWNIVTYFTTEDI